jgi:hypothetical protein
MSSSPSDKLYEILTDIDKVRKSTVKYYNSLSENIKVIDVQEMDGYILQITELKIQKITKTDITLKKFSSVSTVKKLLKLMDLLYKSIDLDIDTVDISSTRASEIKKHFEYMTKLYTSYISSLKTLYNSLVDFLCKDLIKKNVEPSVVQVNFHKHPNSIDLYVEYMNIRINDRKYMQQVSKLLEVDKSRALSESKFINPLLTFGLTPIKSDDKNAVEWDTLDKILELKNASKITNSIATKLQACIIQIKRGTNTAMIYQLPKSGTRNKGAGPENINRILVEHKGQSRLGWGIEIFGSAFANKRVIYVESLSSKLHRKLQNKYNTLISSKILEKQFGRPAKISEFKNRELILNQSHINLTTDKSYSKIEVNMFILQVKEMLRKIFSESGITKFFTEKTGFATVFEKYLDTIEIQDETKTHVAFKLFQMEDEFYNELMNAYNREEDEITNIMTWFDKYCPIVLGTILKAEDNIFDMIASDNYVYGHVLQIS